MSVRLKDDLGEFNGSAVSSFISFLVIPSIFLAMGLPARRGLALGKLDLGALVSILAYQLFGLWVIAYYWSDPEYFTDYELGSANHLRYIALLAIYVPSVDFFTRRVVHLEIMKVFGARTGFLLGTAAWLLGHIPEVIWISELMGQWGALAFILVSGLFTGLLYWKYRNVIGLMAGHWLMNVIISTVTSGLQK